MIFFFVEGLSGSAAADLPLREVAAALESIAVAIFFPVFRRVWIEFS
jgi:hypothetical protein